MNIKMVLATAFISLLLFSALVGVQFVRLAVANPLPVASLKMPEEYINYTIFRVNGSLWAKVDGTYPIYKFGIEYQDPEIWVNNTGFTFNGDTLPMVYPTPPGTTNISLKLNETELNWSNYTQIVPDAVHYTAIGDWPMIYCIIYPVLDHFILRIHYEHPIELVNGSYTFLYDLNINPYLSPWVTKSTAYYNLRFETDYTNLQVNTVRINGTLNPVDYRIKKEAETKTVKLQVVSEYSKPLPGDLLISFIEDKPLESTNSGFSSSNLPPEYRYTVVAVTVAIAAISGYLFLNHQEGNKKR
jgi:hypothetical protein